MISLILIYFLLSERQRDQRHLHPDPLGHPTASQAPLPEQVLLVSLPEVRRPHRVWHPLVIAAVRRVRGEGHAGRPTRYGRRVEVREKQEHTLFNDLRRKFTRRTKIQFYYMKDNENYKVIIISLYDLGILEVEERGGSHPIPKW